MKHIWVVKEGKNYREGQVLCVCRTKLIAEKEMSE